MRQKTPSNGAAGSQRIGRRTGAAAEARVGRRGCARGSPLGAPFLVVGEGRRPRDIRFGTKKVAGSMGCRRSLTHATVLPPWRSRQAMEVARHAEPAPCPMASGLDRAGAAASQRAGSWRGHMLLPAPGPREKSAKPYSQAIFWRGVPARSPAPTAGSRLGPSRRGWRRACWLFRRR